VGLQIAGRRFKDEETLAAAKAVEEIVREEMERAFEGKKVKTATPLAMVFATKRHS
jgi:hypothetical protein